MLVAIKARSGLKCSISHLNRELRPDWRHQGLMLTDIVVQLIGKVIVNNEC
jgi:hypothetical protein